MCRKYFIILPAFYLILWLMKSSKSFEKIAFFENMTAGFLLWSQNLLRYFTPETISGMEKIDFHKYFPMIVIDPTAMSLDDS